MYQSFSKKLSNNLYAKCDSCSSCTFVYFMLNWLTHVLLGDWLTCRRWWCRPRSSPRSSQRWGPDRHQVPPPPLAGWSAAGRHGPLLWEQIRTTHQTTVTGARIGPPHGFLQCVISMQSRATTRGVVRATCHHGWISYYYVWRLCVGARPWCLWTFTPHDGHMWYCCKDYGILQ